MLSQEEMDPVDEREECEECDSDDRIGIDDLLDPGKGTQPQQMSTYNTNNIEFKYLSGTVCVLFLKS